MSKKYDLHIRLNEDENSKIKENTNKFGFHSTSEFIRYIGINVKEINIKIDENGNL